MPQPRFGYRRSFFSDYFPPGLKWLLIVNTGVFVLDFLVPPLHRLLWTLFALTADGVIHGVGIPFVWQLFTYMFLHGGILHLLFNMLTLWFFGSQIERDWGTRRFLKYYFLCGIAAGVCVVIANLLTVDVPTIGASGAIFGVLVAFAVLYPNQTVLMNFLFPIKAKYMVMIYAAIELLMTMRPGQSGVSTIAHLGGMAFGYVYLKGRLPRVRVPEVGSAYKQWKLQRAKKKFQVYMRKHGNGPWVN
jgi:membrane associated rhomboid family serine protease